MEVLCRPSIDMEISISTSILFLLHISIDDTFEASIGIEYRQYFWKVSLTTLPITHGRKACSTDDQYRWQIDNAERSLHQVWESAGWLSSSVRYGGADPWTHLNTSKVSLKSIHSIAFDDGSYYEDIKSSTSQVAGKTNGIRWKDNVIHEEVQRRTGMIKLENILIQKRLRWLGHFHCISPTAANQRFVRHALHWQLDDGHRKHGWSRKIGQQPWHRT